MTVWFICIPNKCILAARVTKYFESILKTDFFKILMQKTLEEVLSSINILMSKIIYNNIERVSLKKRKFLPQVQSLTKHQKMRKLSKKGQLLFRREEEII